MDGCEHVNDLSCEFQISFPDYSLDYTLWVTSQGVNTHVTKDDVERSQLIDVMPGDNLMFSPPQFNVSRDSNIAYLSFMVPMVPWLNNYTISDFGFDEGFELEYFVQYYGLSNDGKSIMVAKQHKRIFAESGNETIITSVTDDMYLCVAIQYRCNEWVENITSNFTEHCIPPLKISNRNLGSSIQIVWLILSGIFFIITVLIVVSLCRKNKSALFKWIFNIKHININPNLFTEQADQWKKQELQEFNKYNTEVADVFIPGVYSEEHGDQRKMVIKSSSQRRENIYQDDNKFSSKVLPFPDRECLPYLKKYSPVGHSFEHSSCSEDEEVDSFFSSANASHPRLPESFGPHHQMLDSYSTPTAYVAIRSFNAIEGPSPNAVYKNSEARLLLDAVSYNNDTREK
ncbi:uncharacterized protein LOC100179510 [Ciona intestinalis]